MSDIDPAIAQKLTQGQRTATKWRQRHAAVLSRAPLAGRSALTCLARP